MTLLSNDKAGHYVCDALTEKIYGYDTKYRDQYRTFPNVDSFSIGNVDDLN